MKLKSFSKYVVNAGVAAALGMGASAAVAAPTSFSVNATVQNALTISNQGEMELGTIFATNASSGYYRYMTLSPASTFNNSQGSSSTTLLSLSTPTAAIGRLNALTVAPFTVTLPDSETTLSPAGTPAYTPGTSPVAVTHLTVPASAQFALVNFRVGNPVNATVDTGCATARTCQVTPTAAGNVDFSIGATLTTGITGGTAYSSGAYLGSFDVEATY